MTSGPNGPFSRPGTSSPPSGRRRSPLIPTLIAVAVLVVGFVYFTQIYTDVLWYNQIGFLEVFVTENLTRIALFLGAFLIMAAAVYTSIRVAYRSRPVYAPDSSLQESLSRYQAQLEPIRRILMIGIPVVVGGFAGAAAMNMWQQVLLFIHRVEFGQTDPQFNMDYSFYLNTLPFLGFLVGFLLSVVVISGIAGLLTHYLYGGIRLEEKGIFVSRPARIHIAVIAAAFLVLQAANYWLDRYATLQDTSGNWTGAMYTDVEAVIPTRTILAIAALIVAVLFILSAFIGRWRLPIIGTAMLIITAIVAGGVYPWLIQQYQVRPSELALERQYIQRNIDLTRVAYGLDDTEVIPYNATTEAASGALADDVGTTENVRLLDPNVVSDTFRQLQQFRQYYQFSDTLSVDRYDVDGDVQDTVIAVRELNMGGVPSGWVNEHVNYTHGYGVVAARGSTVQPDGKPSFMESGIPSSGVLGNYEPRIYFGEQSPDYSVVGAPEGTDPVEIDRPQTGNSEEETLYTYTGDGGPSVGNLFNRLAYAIKFQSTELLLAESINEESQILYDRDPRERVEKVAPYLTVDSNAYPAVVDERVVWMVDAYTTSEYFPYSTKQELQSATTDSLTPGQMALPPEQVNYIRNAVKATVDAYDGTVTLYAWDDTDPLLKAWQKVFPSSLKPYSEMSADLIDHVRYPEDQFKVQRELLGRYHVTDADSFYRNDDAWSVPLDPTQPSANEKQPPYYLSLQMPGQEETTFSLTSTFIPFVAENSEARNVLYGFLSADGDAGTGADGEKAENYGALRLLSLPTDTAVPGPGQAQNRFNSDPTVSNALNLLRQGASEVINGNLLSLPVGGGMLYVQPVYVQSSGDASYPTLQRVLVNFGERVGFAPTLDEALNQVFGGDSGAVTGDSENAGEAGTEAGTTPGGGTGTDQEELSRALSDAGAALQEGQAALSEGDFAAYGEAQTKLQDAIRRATEAQDRIDGANGATAPESGDGGTDSGSDTGGGSDEG
ncbi:hypothetical protein BN1051_02045 [Arthrobacter saudimassiliensis]|uniref:UPF0182 protein BN1051_02045 n=1 Tax=Arthrobacter saudimassiliensis TaxID=1461584 RepID=A0A078MTG5_9MICC|nr:hypothetical protein BN1051_02045 [Arthrobacter saudimassiliensis]